ncbi:leukotriene B4 receptor 1-like [Kryptolebias marmoratus]|uniref:leukotriene B4 receptor 1-like n=1 Tax=Kryptolebias marmoratus TaxID=37003 RepID=UPI0007F8B9C1|nr:leukotriene B4 receptor 1-like [Kryptolebias marmoratus]
MDQLNSTVATSNSSSPGLLPQPFWNSRRLVPAVLFSFCFSVGVPGNIAVIILRPNWEHMSRLSQSLLLNLAVSDLLCLLTFPLLIDAYLHGWRVNLVSCKLLAYVVYCSIYCSQLTVTGLSIQRYLLVVHQQDCQQVKKRLIVVLHWLVAFILSIPHLVVQQLVPNQQWTDCRAQYSSDAQWVAVRLTETIPGIVSFITVVFSYIRISRKVNQAAFFNNPQTTRLITSIIVSFVVLWVPYFTNNVLGIVAICLGHEGLKKFYLTSWDFLSSLTTINKCLNPLLYAFTSRKVCNVFQKQEPMQQDQRMPDSATTAELS